MLLFGFYFISNVTNVINNYAYCYDSFMTIDRWNKKGLLIK